MGSLPAKPVGAELALDFSGPDRKRLVLVLRALVIATLAYLVLDARHDSGATHGLGAAHDLGWLGLASVAVFAASNGGLALAPKRIFWRPYFGPTLLLVDTAVILSGLSWSHGFQRELLLAYFFTLFLITAGETVGQIAVGSALIAGLYGYWMSTTSGLSVASDLWVRVPFFFFIAVFYASLIEQLKRERHRRRSAEEDNRHLRLVLDLASSFSRRHPSREFVKNLGHFIEGTCPGLECHLFLDGEREDTVAGENFALRAHERTYGMLRVGRIDAGDLSVPERWLCQMVSHAAAGALYAAEKASASESAEEVKEQFLATISHELRTPLHAILGYVEMLDTLLPEDGEPLMRESLQRARVNAERLQALLDGLLSLTEIRSGQAIVSPKLVDLATLLDEIASAGRSRVRGGEVIVACDVLPGIGKIRTDEKMLRRALACLLDNAVKFTEKGRIELRASPASEGWVDVSIVDTGIGIDADAISVVFDEFRQADGSMTCRYGGLGMGLPLAREIVTLLGGSIEVTSEVGQGTSVLVRLPLQCLSSPRAAVVPSVRQPTRRGRAQRLAARLLFR